MRYPNGGGWEQRAIAETIKSNGRIVHVPAGAAHGLSVGDSVTAALDWDKRYQHMRVHTALHLLCSAVDGGVTGGQIGAGKGRLDFALEPETVPDKEALAAQLNALVAADHPISISSITDADLENNPDLVRTMSVKPPTGAGRVRMIRIGDDVDYQPCGGTHVASTGEIGGLVIGKIENKGKQNRRINIALTE